MKGVLDPCDDNNAKSGWDEMRVDNGFDIDGDFSDTQVNIKESIPISYSAIALICILMCINININTLIYMTWVSFCLKYFDIISLMDQSIHVSPLAFWIR